MQKIIVHEVHNGATRWDLVAGNNVIIAQSPPHANVKAAQQSAAKVRDTMFPQPKLIVRRTKNRVDTRSLP